MKLRLEQNSLRLRLSEAEVMQFADTGHVAYTITFGPGETQVLRYSLETLPTPSDVSVGVQVRYEAGALAVEVPAGLAHEWTSTEKNGFSAQVIVANGQQLRILVEKDLDCQH